MGYVGTTILTVTYMVSAFTLLRAVKKDINITFTLWLYTISSDTSPLMVFTSAANELERSRLSISSTIGFQSI